MTKTVTRYRIAVDSEFDTWGEPEPDGEWVKYDDIKHLLQDEPKASLAKLAGLNEHGIPDGSLQVNRGAKP